MCLCLCFDVSKSEIKKSIREGCDSMEKLSEHLKVGSHCGGCVGQIEEILEKKKSGHFFRSLGFSQQLPRTGRYQ
jgi:nitrite reductase (NADH) large subunit